VANVPDFCFDEVADTAMSLILSVPRKVHLVNAAVHKGIWNKDAAKPVRKFAERRWGSSRSEYRPQRCQAGDPVRLSHPRHDAYLAPNRCGITR